MNGLSLVMILRLLGESVEAEDAVYQYSLLKAFPFATSTMLRGVIFDRLSFFFFLTATPGSTADRIVAKILSIY